MLRVEWSMKQMRHPLVANMTDNGPMQLPMNTPSQLERMKRRTTDLAAGQGAAVPVDDPESLYQAWRSGAHSLSAMAHLAPIEVIFSWHAQRKISEAEFIALLAAQEVQEVQIGDLPKAERNDEDAAAQRMSIMVGAVKSRLETLAEISVHDQVGEAELSEVFRTNPSLIDGVGLRIVFSAPPGPPAESGPPPPTGTLTLLCRAYAASTSIRSAAKCEAVFMSAGLPTDFYCRIVLPMPVIKGGRRRLFVSVLDNETRHPINLPPPVAELFQEKYIQQLQLMRRPGTGGSGLEGLVKRTLARWMGK